MAVSILDLIKSQVAAQTGSVEIPAQAKNTVLNGLTDSIFGSLTQTVTKPGGIDAIKSLLTGIDDNYSRVFFSYFKDGKVEKAFLLPQEDPELHISLLKSYNRPEFMVEPVKISVDEFSKVFDK